MQQALASLSSKLKHYLDDKQPTSQPLVSWLVGEGIPPVDLGMDYAHWLLDALHALPDDGGYPALMTRQVASILEHQDEALLQVANRAGLISGLLTLATDLAPAPLLMKGLKRLLDNTSIAELFQSENLGDGLRQALAWNQDDDSLRDTWLGLLRGNAQKNAHG